MDFTPDYSGTSCQTGKRWNQQGRIWWMEI